MYRFTSVFFIIALLYAIPSYAGQQWLLYHDDEIKGSVVNADTKEPLEGAIVVSMWALVQIPGEGFGGYAKIQVVDTDKQGNFIIPSWTTFKPWKLLDLTHGLAPEIVIYKPGYKVYWSHSVMRDGFQGDISKTAEEKERLKEEYSINPAKLKRVYTDEERLENYYSLGTNARFPDKHFSKEQSKIIFDALEQDMLQLTENYKDKRDILGGIKNLRESWAGGKK